MSHGIPTEMTGGPNAPSVRASTPAWGRRIDAPTRPTPRSVDIPEVIPADRNEVVSRLLNFTLGNDILPPLLVTFGLSVIIQNALLEVFTADSRRLNAGPIEVAAVTAQIMTRLRNRAFMAVTPGAG